MKKTEAIAAIETSLSRGSSTPCSWSDDREAYISEKSAELVQSIIDPVRVTIVGETYSYGIKDQFAGKEVFAVARRADDWLLYVPEIDAFSLAFGNNEKALTILGFASKDALAEWLG